jgi:osmotically-inducible protein OsmY
MGKGMEIATVYRDEDVGLRVRDFLLRQHFPTLHELDISIEDGALTLQGQVGSFYEKQIAISICQRVPGVLIFIDKIAVAAV